MSIISGPPAPLISLYYSLSFNLTGRSYEVGLITHSLSKISLQLEKKSTTSTKNNCWAYILGLNECSHAFMQPSVRQISGWTKNHYDNLSIKSTRTNSSSANAIYVKHLQPRSTAAMKKILSDTKKGNIIGTNYLYIHDKDGMFSRK